MNLNVYEGQIWQNLDGGKIRPGGFGLTDQLIKAANLDKEHMVVDIGCGLGETVAYLEQEIECKAIGVDISETLLMRARQNHPDILFQKNDGVRMDFVSHSVDCAMGECSFSVMDTPRVLQECARIVKPGGWLLLSDVYATNRVNDTQSLYTKSAWYDMISKTNFDIILWEDQSQLWKHFAAQILWEYGDLSPILNCCDKQTLKQCKPGYFILAAMKR